MDISLREAKQQADRLTSRLKELGVNIKRTQALEGIAAVHNFSDWNRFQAGRNSKALPADAAHTNERSAADIIQGRGPHRVLLLRPGEGKTSILTLIFAEAMREQSGVPIWIDCDDGVSRHNIPSFVLDQTTIVTAHFDSQGNIEVLTEIDPDCRGIWVSLLNTEIRPYSANGLEIRARALINLLALIRNEWPKLFTSRISWALFDGFSSVSGEYPTLFSNALPEFAGHNTTVVIASQLTAMHIAASSPLRCRFISSKDTQMVGSKFKDAVSPLDDLVIADANLSLPPSLESTESLVESFAKLVLVGLTHRDVKYQLGNSGRARLVEEIFNDWNQKPPTPQSCLLG